MVDWSDEEGGSDGEEGQHRGCERQHRQHRADKLDKRHEQEGQLRATTSDQEEGQQRQARRAAHQQDAVGERPARETRGVPSAPSAAEDPAGQPCAPAQSAATPTSASALDFFLEKFFAAGKHVEAADLSPDLSPDLSNQSDQSDQSSLVQRPAAAALPCASAGLESPDSMHTAAAGESERQAEKSEACHAEGAMPRGQAKVQGSADSMVAARGLELISDTSDGEKRRMEMFVPLQS